MSAAVQPAKAATDLFAEMSLPHKSEGPLARFRLGAAPELELLICCARRQLHHGQSARVFELLERGVDWDFLLSLACAHGLCPLLYSNLSSNFSRLLPSAVAKEMEDSFKANLRHNLCLTLELVNVLKLLASNGISVVPFKGPTLAEALYGNLALRQCSDLDLFIRPNDVPAAIETLVSQGYSPVLQLTRAQQSAWVRSHYEFGLISPSGVLIELQWAIVPKYFSLSFGPRHFWDDLKNVRIGSAEAVTLSSENLLLVLCIHGSKHQWSRLVWLSDIAEMVQVHTSLNWDRLLWHARANHAERMLLLGLCLAQTVFGTALPENINLLLAEDKTLVGLSRQVCVNLVRPSEPGYLATHLFLIRTRERWIDKIRYILRFIFTPATVEWSIVRLPTILFPFYSALRMTRGFLKLGTLLRHWARRRRGNLGSRTTF